MLDQHATLRLDPPTAAPPPKRSSGPSARRLLALGLVAFLAAALAGRIDLESVARDARDVVDGGPIGASSSESVAVAEVKDVIARANVSQAEAFAQTDPARMRATATDAFYEELVRTNRALASSGVTSIELVRIEWGDVTIAGTTARAIANETWRSTWNDGSVEERTDRNDYTLVRQGGTWRIESLVQPDARVIDPGSTIPAQPGMPAASSASSSNWSGYAASGGVFTAVTGSWVVPTVSTATAGADATWVGIGGLTSRDLIQAGTMATVSGGAVTYQAWIEMLPAAARPIALDVTAGDAVTVTITQRSGNDWLIGIKNDTTGDTYSVTVQYASTNSSAEWVQEAPSVGRGLVPLSQFGTVRFSRASAVRDGVTMSIADLGARAITMINASGQPVAQPSTLESDGSSFSVTRTEAPSSGGGRRRRP